MNLCKFLIKSDNKNIIFIFDINVCTTYEREITSKNKSASVGNGSMDAEDANAATGKLIKNSRVAMSVGVLDLSINRLTLAQRSSQLECQPSGRGSPIGKSHYLPFSDHFVISFCHSVVIHY